MTKDSEIIDWFCDNKPEIQEILNELDQAKLKLMEMEPVVFHEDIEKEFYDLATTKIADLATKTLAIPIEMVYSVIEDKKLLIDNLKRNN